MKPLLVVVVILLVFWMCSSNNRENFKEIFGASGYKKPVSDTQIDYDINFDDSDFSLQTGTGITADDVRSCVVPTVEMVKRELNLCVVPIETSSIELYKDENGRKLFKCRFMMMVKDVGFPFGFGITVDVLDGVIVLAKTQPMNSVDEFAGYDERSIGDNFLPASDLLPKPKSL